MYAIVEVGGQQFKVAKNDLVRVPKLMGEVGSTIDLDRVMLVADETGTRIGNPLVQGAQVKASIVQFERGDKVIGFKKRRRKSYRLKKGHRQDYTRIKIEDIVVN